jgi:hypothetical protein
MAGLSSSGWLSNQPLANKSKTLVDKAKENAQVVAQKVLPDEEGEAKDQGMHAFPELCQGERTTDTALLGDEWYDTDNSSSQDSLSPTKSMSADVYHSHLTVKSITPDEQAALMPYSTISLPLHYYVLAYSR